MMLYEGKPFQTGRFVALVSLFRENGILRVLQDIRSWFSVMIILSIYALTG